MAKNLILPNQVGNSFYKEDSILNYRPTIKFIEPEQEEDEQEFVELPPTINDNKNRTQVLVDGFNNISKVLDKAQQRVDDKVKLTGGLSIKLDPIKDFNVISAMKRKFPDKKDPAVIDYEDYKKALDCINNNSPNLLNVSNADIELAKQNPLKTDFGGSNNTNGENRSDLSSPFSTVQPVDISKYQKVAVLALFAMLLPMIKAEDKKEVALHLATVPHV